jgi:Acyl-CoA synthetases (AMP-forming)/AMP-acid ligases II
MPGWPQFPRYTDPIRHFRRLAPDRIALIDRPRGVRQSYAEFDVAIDRWALLLSDANIRKGDRVAVLSGNRHEVAELFFACSRVGAALVPLNWRLAPAELAGILLHSQSSLLVGESRFMDSLSKSIRADETPRGLTSMPTPRQSPALKGVPSSTSMLRRTTLLLFSTRREARASRKA